MKIRIENKDLKIEKDVDAKTGRQILSLLFTDIVPSVPVSKPKRVSFPVERVRKVELPKEVIDFLRDNPRVSILKIGRKFNVSPSSLQYYVKKLKLKRHHRGLKKSELKEIRQFIKDNPKLQVPDIADKYMTSASTLRRHFTRELNRAKEWREEQPFVKGKLPPLVPTLPSQVSKDERTYHKPRYYKRTREVIRKMILSNEIPEEFTSGIVFKRVFKNSTMETYRKDRSEFYSRMNIIRSILNRMKKEGKIELARKEPVIMKGGVTSKRMRFIWRKLFKPEEEVKELQKELQLFPFTSVSYEKGLQAVKQAVHDGKLTYLKDGRFFGYDMRSQPDANWLKLLTFVTRYVRQEKLARDVTFDFNTQSLKFRKGWFR